MHSVAAIRRVASSSKRSPELNGESKVEKMEPTPSQEAAPRILARQLARPLTDEEIDLVAGGLRPNQDTWCETGCPTNDCGT
jgi:hypothetical protein